MMIVVAKKPAKQQTAKKVVDDELVLMKPRKGAKLREEVWQTADGAVVRYNLAYINHRICGVDNGRVLGYDNSHGQHHRHFMGNVERVEFKSYEALVRRFRRELEGLWRKQR
jgi:hypothetical protein